ncbi:mechanosensitive ion channel family protein [Hydrogenovibrio halophilus]|uniref:mechanosensitive ion channel family protein n=1 Tax=Hydrogenovibrio halophilus TaxID=373391 RepID=UPI00035EF825|nr:mechanosensitive ion channel family protein [Hydrogenovibrio halophilus]
MSQAESDKSVETEFVMGGLESLISLFPEFWQGLILVFAGQEWLLLVTLLLGLTFVIDVFFRLVVSRFDRRFKRKNQHFPKSLTEAIQSPLSVYIWLGGVSITLVTLIGHFDLFTRWVEPIEGARFSLNMLILAWFAFRWLRRMESHLKAMAEVDSRWDSITVEAVAKVLKITVFVFTGMVVLSAFDVDLTGLIAFGGFGGIAVGFAAKDILGNVLGGMMLYMDKPFAPGDWVRSPDRNIEGVVQKIGWRITEIQTFDKRPLYIPNGTFSSIGLENPSRMTHRRIYETVGVRYCDVGKMAGITGQIRQMLEQHPEIDESQTLIVNFNLFNQSTLDIMIYTFTHTREWVKFHAVKEDVLLKVSEIVAEAGAEMAFPTRTLYLEDTVQVSGMNLPSEPASKPADAQTGGKSSG